jgi:hypothetical protein
MCCSFGEPLIYIDKCIFFTDKIKISVREEKSEIVLSCQEFYFSRRAAENTERLDPVMMGNAFPLAEDPSLYDVSLRITFIRMPADRAAFCRCRFG